ncbi:hypothetical protein G5I_02954 [Acromyrmex echinatior]|uniref:Uncharacterized protein n=1 Tax=Acromyrmex echinatior TaxID=103372 RepID=F4WBN5_ACREC|nr:hypothetical protein G5I_02954 [Acromyrmex echinatior]
MLEVVVIVVVVVEEGKRASNGACKLGGRERSKKTPLLRVLMGGEAQGGKTKAVQQPRRNRVREGRASRKVRRREK